MPEPTDPITGLAEQAVQLHEMFLAFRHAGFNERQALELVIAIAIQSSGDE